MTDKTIYFDYQATTPTDERVISKMLPYFNERFGNPHSKSHAFGWNAEQAVFESRNKIATNINANPAEIIFTSGATESNNLALQGAAGYYGKNKKHIISLKTEHKCVINTLRYLETQGFKVDFAPIDEEGTVDIEALEKMITDDTFLISIMAANNEIGTIQPIAQIGKIAKQHNIIFHTDAAQALGKMPIDVEAMNIDLMSMSSHKIYGPMGIGALYVRKKPRIRLTPMLQGGGQERGLRSGTLPTPLIVGFGEAVDIACLEMQAEAARLTDLRDYMWNTLNNEIESIKLNGAKENRLPGNLNISFNFIEGESLMMGLKGLALSSGSACTSGSLEPSYVLAALGVSEDSAHSSIRISLGRFTSKEDVDYACKLFIREVNKLREMSPLWEMHQNGIDLSTINWSEH